MLLAVAAFLALSLATYLFLNQGGTIMPARIGVPLLLLICCLLAAGIIIGLTADRQFGRQQRLEENLRMDRDFLHAVLNTVSAIVVGLDRQFRIVFFNHQGEETTGYSRAEVLGQHLWDSRLLPADSKQMQTTFEEIMHTGQTRRMENLCRTQNGEQRLMSWTYSNLADKNGRPEYIIATGVDINDSRRISSRLGQAKRDWEATFDVIDEAIIINDNEMNIVKANAAARKIIGLQLPEIIGQKCYALLHGSSEPPDYCLAGAALKTHRPAVAEIYESHLQKHIKVAAYPRIDESNTVIGLIQIISDISKRKSFEEEQQKLQAQLLQSQKLEAIGQLAGGVAHDFNNLLTGIIGFVGLARDQVDNDSPICSDLDETIALAKRASDLTRQLLAFSRRQILEPEPLNLNDLVQNMSKMLKRLIGEDITLEFQPAPELDFVNADPGQIEQVLVNLAVNSRQAMPQGGTLTVATAKVLLDESESLYRQVDIPPGPYIRLTVADTGVGIDKSIQELIFDPFFTTKEIGIGSGLGLSTAYGIIKQHQGFIWVESEPGKGAVFIISLPAAEQKLPAGGDLPRPEGDPPSATILVVEDDVAVLQVTQRMLSRFGYRVLTAIGPDEAETMFAQNRDAISLLLIDVILPKRNGRELYAALIQSKPSLPVLYMSGHTQDMLVQKGVLGAESAFVKKPFSPDDLRSKIGSLLSTR